MSAEREYLDRFLDKNRAALVTAVQGLTEKQARSALVSSLTTPIGIVKHCAAAERGWFQRAIGGRSAAECDGYARGDDQSWQVPAGQTLAEVIAEFEHAGAISRELVAGHDLDEKMTHYRLGGVTVRWIYLHMIGELARHAGHADILVEQLTRPRGSAADA